MISHHLCCVSICALSFFSLSEETHTLLISTWRSGNLPLLWEFRQSVKGKIAVMLKIQVQEHYLTRKVYFIEPSKSSQIHSTSFTPFFPRYLHSSPSAVCQHHKSTRSRLQSRLEALQFGERKNRKRQRKEKQTVWTTNRNTRAGKVAGNVHASVPFSPYHFLAVCVSSSS